MTATLTCRENNQDFNWGKSMAKVKYLVEQGKVKLVHNSRAKPNRKDLPKIGVEEINLAFEINCLTCAEEKVSKCLMTNPTCRNNSSLINAVLFSAGLYFQREVLTQKAFIAYLLTQFENGAK